MNWQAIWGERAHFVIFDAAYGDGAAFQNTLHSIFREYAIPIHEIRERSYQARYEQAVQYIEKHIYGKSQTS